MQQTLRNQTSRSQVAPPHLIDADAARLIVISGCSGGGKSTLLEELSARGWRIACEPGRQIVREQHLIGGNAVPSKDLSLFVELCISRAAHFYREAAAVDEITLFDRSVVDAVTALRRHGMPVPVHLDRALDVYGYAPTVFMAPPWETLFKTDRERQHTFEEAVDEYHWLVKAYQDLGYAIETLPLGLVGERADWLEKRIQEYKETLT